MDTSGPEDSDRRGSLARSLAAAYGSRHQAVPSGTGGPYPPSSRGMRSSPRSVPTQGGASPSEDLFNSMARGEPPPMWQPQRQRGSQDGYGGGAGRPYPPPPPYPAPANVAAPRQPEMVPGSTPQGRPTLTGDDDARGEHGWRPQPWPIAVNSGYDPRGGQPGYRGPPGWPQNFQGMNPWGGPYQRPPPAFGMNQW